MTTTLTPLKKHLRKIYPTAVNEERQKLLLLDMLEQSTISADDFEKATAAYMAHAIDFIQQARTVAGVGRELKAMPSLSEKLADALTMAEYIDYIGAVDYIGLAKSLELGQEEIFFLALKELSTYEGGPEKLTELVKALNRVLTEEDEQAEG